jgi:hypothetical protein
MPVGSWLPEIANWLSPAIRGLLAMAPPPPPLPPPATPCVGVPNLPPDELQPLCGECPYDSTKQCAFVDLDGDGNPDVAPLPLAYRGFDDPQADPDPTLSFRQSVTIDYKRADLYDLGAGLGIYQSDDSLTGNPQWGSDPGTPDNDADGVLDPSTIPDRHNQGMYAAIFDPDVPFQRDQQFPNDAFAGISCPFPPLANPCDVYAQDCGGMAKFDTAKPSDPASATGFFNPYPVVAAPPAQANWPVVPFPRDWIPSDTPSAPAIKKLLRFASSVVSYDSTATHMSEYRLEENARNVVTTAPGTPLAGVLKDAYDYLVNSVFPLTDDPAINCRNYVIVFVTDGLEECFGNPCSGGPTGKGPAGDLGALLLPENPAGARAAAHANDSSVPVDAVPVYVIGLGLDPNAAVLQCIANNSSSTTDPSRKGQVFGATNRTTLRDALQSILSFKRNENSFVAPSVPGFASGTGADTAQIGAVIPSHKSTDGTLSQWSIWSGSLKSYRLDSNGAIPVVTAAVAAGTPTPTPSTFGTGGYPDESTPDDPNPSNRKPVWNAARVLGYTNPVANLAQNSTPVGPMAPNAPQISVWPGRKMVWGSGTSVPMTRNDFFCPGASCSAGLVNAMGLTSSGADALKAKLTVDFLRGGLTANGSRDEVLNQPSVAPPGAPIGPNAGQQQKYSYFYQDDTPPPGTAPQVQTDGATSPPGYAHKLGDIFHSEPLMIGPPNYFQYLSANLNNYATFASTHQFRRKVLAVGANDGFLHLFDAGVWNRDAGGTFDSTWDLGTGREIAAYAPASIMSGNFPALLNIPPRPQYFVDGSMGKADVFIDVAGDPTGPTRIWRSVIVGGLRQGGNSVWALDVTQPDKIDAQGVKTASKDNAPDCLNGGGGGCGPTGATTRKYPEILWETTDNTIPRMGQTWSRPTVGRIRVLDGGTGASKDKYVAIFGGGFDPNYRPGDPLVMADQVCPPTCPARKATAGRAIYIVDVETGKILTKITQGNDSSAGTVDFPPMPAPPSAVDFDDDGYLDVAYIGDVNGRMWRVDLTPDSASSRGICNSCETSAQTVTGYSPFAIYDAATTDGSTPSTQPNEPIFQDPGVVFVNGGVRPSLGIAFGTGDRAELARTNTSVQRFYYILDNNQSVTFHEGDLRDITPSGGVTTPGTGPGTSNNGFFLDFATGNEKTLTSVLSTNGFLTLITFTPDSTSPCATNGESFRYRFFFLNGKGGYNTTAPTGTFADYRESMGAGPTTESQVTLSNGTTTNLFVRSDKFMMPPEIVPGDLSTINSNWKEQQ